MSTPRLTSRIKKNADGSAALSCTRGDGTVTWQRQLGAQGRFFPLHDLTHFAVETVLRHGRGFYGLVASGWDISDFGPPWPRGRLPEDMDPSELIVGFLDVERASGTRWQAEDFNDKAATYYRDRVPGRASPTLSDKDLARIRQRRAELFAEWDAVAPGGTLELTFDLESKATAEAASLRGTAGPHRQTRTR